MRLIHQFHFYNKNNLSDGFAKLCPQGPGRGDTGGDINECLFMADVCENGECINTDGSFRCECQTGFVLDSTRKRCIGNL